MSDETIRQRLVLVTTPLSDEGALEALRRALSGGDVASVLIDPAGRENTVFQTYAEPLVAAAQEAGVAAIIIDDTRCAGRLKADGVHLTQGDAAALAEATSSYQPKLIVGASGFETRHGALEAGEAGPDYILFGRLGQDGDEVPHAKTLSMAEWWSAMVEIPCIALGARDVESVADVARTGAEFVALGAAVFAEPGKEAERVARANAILDDFEVLVEDV